ncbi:hypothetical protein [Lacimonas salitolerans]|uniref:Uncharacterized protein n=1 Tax=Lacimonas salitolerans TaxID=1323750 RepID=A0ABW4EME8_9RHOB
MYGVVLWCSGDSRKAVIWCEDHGDLAYSQDIDTDMVLEAGDLVRFRTEQTRRMRLARDVILVDHERYANLPERLKAAGAQGRGDGAEVVAFDPTARHKRAAGHLTPVAAVV